MTWTECQHKHGQAPRLVLGVALRERLQVAPAVSQLRLRALRALPFVLRVRARAHCLAPRRRGLPLLVPCFDESYVPAYLACA